MRGHSPEITSMGFLKVEVAKMVDAGEELRHLEFGWITGRRITNLSMDQTTIRAGSNPALDTTDRVSPDFSE